MTNINQSEKQKFLSVFNGQQKIWVLAYGSLLWNPGFSPLRQENVSIRGFRRSFCLYSIHYRGSIENPGLVLGLRPGGYMESIALEVSAENAYQVMAYLWDREMISRAYLPCVLYGYSRRFNQPLCCYSFVIDSNHEQYAGHLNDQQKIDLICQAKGTGGDNIEYLLKTAESLRQHHIQDDEIETLLKMLDASRRRDLTI
ncbi:MAG: gamma-glutamylcyclotransferase [Pseudomonadota bacterium]